MAAQLCPLSRCQHRGRILGSYLWPSHWTRWEVSAISTRSSNVYAAFKGVLYITIISFKGSCSARRATQRATGETNDVLNLMRKTRSVYYRQKGSGSFQLSLSLGLHNCPLLERCFPFLLRVSSAFRRNPKPLPVFIMFRLLIRIPFRNKILSLFSLKFFSSSLD